MKRMLSWIYSTLLEVPSQIFARTSGCVFLLLLSLMYLVVPKWVTANLKIIIKEGYNT